MKTRNSTKSKLLSSVIALVLCVSMLIGATFAWFTDTASTAVNKIQAGTLDVALEMYDGTNWVNAEGQTLQFKKAAGASAGEPVLWEPGCTYELPELRIVNKGDLALKYQITSLDLVHAGACRVGEPRKRCADQHGHAQNKCDDAREQLALRAVSGFHM